MPAAVWAIVAACVLWGTTGTAASIVPQTVSPLAIGAATMGIGGLLLFAVNGPVALRALRDPGSRRWLAAGSLGVFVYPLAFYSSMDAAGVAIGNVVSLGTGPLFAALWEWLFERRGLSRRWAISTGIALAGVLLLGVGGVERRGAPGSDPLAGILLGLLAGAAYAWYTYASTRAIAVGHPGRAAMAGMFGIGAILLLPVLFLTGSPILGSGTAVGVLTYLAVGPMFLAYLLFGFGLRTIRSSSATTLTLLEPVVATLLAVAVVGERPGPVAWTGLVLILIGITVLVAARRRPARLQPQYHFEHG
ncbi:MAG: EamA family transporter [Actinomycetota bacterium]|nr:EamA family transporter [Actinomycetota bacterium]